MEQAGVLNMKPKTRRLGGIMDRLQFKTAVYSAYFANSILPQASQ
jgi:hypothetical protein